MRDQFDRADSIGIRSEPVRAEEPRSAGWTDNQPMDEQSVRDHAQAHIEALRAGDIGLASQEMSPELQRNLGELVAMLPLPLTDAAVESVEMAGTAYVSVLRLTGEDGTVRVNARWKDRDGRPTMVEASRVTEAAPEPPGEPSEEEG